jgi:hypothetical protein
MVLDRTFCCNAEFTASGAYNTEDGYRVNTNVPISRSGIFVYKSFEFGRPENNADIVVYRPPEVFDEELIRKFANLPITNDHPDSAVNSATATQVIIGTLGDVSYMDGNNLIAEKAIVFDKESINEIESGIKQEVSIGFNARYTPEEGEVEGQRYSYIEKITGINHLALVRKGKSGSEYRLNEDLSQPKITIKEDKPMVNEEVKTPEEKEAEKDNQEVSETPESKENMKKNEDVAYIKNALTDILSRLNSMGIKCNEEPEKEKENEDEKDKKEEMENSDKDTKSMKNSLDLAASFGNVDKDKAIAELDKKPISGQKMKNSFESPKKNFMQMMSEVLNGQAKIK